MRNVECGMRKEYFMKKILFILFAIAMAFGSASAAENCTGIETGEKAYNEGDFERAIVKRTHGDVLQQPVGVDTRLQVFDAADF